MPLGLGIVLIILVLGLVWFIIYQYQNFKRKSIQNDKEINILREENKESRNKFEESCKRYDGLMDQFLAADEKVNVLKHELIQLQSSIQVEAVKSDSKESLEAELENLKALAAKKLLELEQISANTKQLTELQEEKIKEIGELDSGIKALEGRISSGKEVLEKIESEIKVTEVTLADLANLKASVLAVEEGAGTSWTFSPGDKKRLVELIHQLVDEYGNQFPILRKELLKAEWSSVWLPQVQQLCSREGLDRGGIYRLVLKSNPDCVYIGQAQSIKERWYTHIKKMLGVEAKGTERLYEYRPDDFEWSVVEFKEGNLDSDEKYWIDYYKCREIGLNKKG